MFSLRNASARPYLLLCASDDASEIRALCAKGLGEVGTDIDAVTLKKLIDDPDYRVAVEATRSLARLGMPILRTIHGTGILEGGSFAFINPRTAVVGLSNLVTRP